MQITWPFQCQKGHLALCRQRLHCAFSQVSWKTWKSVSCQRVVYKNRYTRYTVWDAMRLTYRTYRILGLSRWRWAALTTRLWGREQTGQGNAQSRQSRTTLSKRLGSELCQCMARNKGHFDESLAKRGFGSPVQLRELKAGCYCSSLRLKHHFSKLGLSNNNEPGWSDLHHDSEVRSINMEHGISSRWAFQN